MISRYNDFIIKENKLDNSIKLKNIIFNWDFLENQKIHGIKYYRTNDKFNTKEWRSIPNKKYDLLL